MDTEHDSGYIELVDDEDERPTTGLMLHTFEIRGTTEDDLHIYKAITPEAARAILEEMPHIVTEDKPPN